MIAVQISSYGGKEALTINKKAARPKLSRGQILVEVGAAALNPVDNAIMSGYMKDIVPLSFPITLGGDFSGVVVEVGEGVTNFRIDDKVYGQAIVLNGGSGTLAQFVAANAANTAKMPKLMNFVEAASLPLAGVSALQAIEENINLKADQKILIHGGAGGIGSIAIQMAKNLGAYVAVTVSTDDKPYVKKLGADKVIDYTKEAFEEILTDYDAVLCLVGGETINKSFKVLRKDGVLVSLVGLPEPELAGKYHVTAIRQLTATSTGNLNRLTELVDTGKIKVHVAKVFQLNQALEAFTYLTEGHPKGKVVVRIND